MQPADSQELVFHEEADTFNLTATYHEDTLKITLKDFVDWVIYERYYTEDDIGGEINRKMDVIDVYSAFAQSKVECDAENIKEKETGLGKMREYQFGNYVQNQGVPCFKIEKGGKVTVYSVMLDKRVKKQVVNQSKLTLKQVRELTEVEILKEKSLIQKRKLFKELNKQIEKQKKQKEAHLDKINTLEEIILKFKEEANILRAENDLKDQEIKKLKLSNQQSSNNIKQLRQKIKAMQQKIPMNLPQLNSKYFKVEGLQLQYIDNLSAHYFFYFPILPDQSAKFKIKIKKAQSSNIQIGIVDYEKQKDKKQSYNSGNAMCYYGKDGAKRPQNSKEGDGFKGGDIVEVDVDRMNKTVKYAVNGVLKAQHSNDMLADNTRVFMPFVDMYHTNDTVEWLLD